MNGKFLNNIMHLSYGTFLRTFLAFVSTAIVIRNIKVADYALFGLVFSFTSVCLAFDVTYFLTLVKCNSEHVKNKKAFQAAFNTLYNSILISNLFFVAIIFPIMLFLSFAVYQNKGLFPLYLVGASCLFIGRSVSFLKQFIRANKNETIIQKALVASAAIQFLITMLLLFKFHLGIISVFVAVLVATLTEYLILISYTRTSLVRPETYFSWQLLKRLFKRFAIWDYVSKVLNSTLFYGGLFIATFFLGYKEIAILTIVLSLCNRILDVFSVVGFHLSVIYSSLLARRQLISLRQVAIALNYLLVNLMVVVELLLLTVGNVAYEWYFGKQMEGSYYIFLLIAAGFLAIAVSISPRTLVYVADIRLYTRITILSVSLFVALLVLLGKAFGLAGVAFAYFFAYFLRSTMFYLFSRKFAGKYPGKIRKDSIIVSAFLLALLLLGRGAQLPFAALVKVYLFIIALGLITLFNHSDIRKALNFLNSKI